MTKKVPGYRRRKKNKTDLIQLDNLNLSTDASNAEKADVERRERRARQMPLSRYLSRGQIDEEMFEAGCRLRRDFFKAGMSPYYITDLARSPGRSPARQAMSESMMEAADRYRAALKKLGPGLAEVVFAVCCLDETARNFARTSLVSPCFQDKDGISLLRMGLLNLYRYYRRR